MTLDWLLKTLFLMFTSLRFWIAAGAAAVLNVAFNLSALGCLVTGVCVAYLFGVGR